MTRARAREPRSTARPVSRPHDTHEREAQRAAAAVTAGHSVAGWSFSSVPTLAPIQREEWGTPKTEEEQYEEARGAAAERAFEIPEVKALKDKVLAHPAVKIAAGSVIVGGVTALGVAGKPLPFQIPAMPLDSITPGLSAQLIIEDRVDRPSAVSLTLSYEEQGPEKKKAPNAIAADIARLKAQEQLFKPAAQKAEEKRREQELVAAWVAAQRLRIPVIPPPKPTDAEGKEDAAKTPVQRAAASATPAPPTHAHVDDAIADAGRPLEPSARRVMEARFGRDFSTVRIHDDARAARAADAIDAAAFTVGQDIAFAAGSHDPHSAAGRRLLAHELTHVVQQVAPPRPVRVHTDAFAAAGAPAHTAARAPDEPAPETDATSAPPIVHEALAGPATTLDPGTRAFMESRFGYDFSRVRLHCDGRAATSADAVGADAYTVGRDVVFGRGRYAPQTPAGRVLLAHELAHVTQDGADVAPASIGIGRADDPLERAADRAAVRALAPSRAPATSAAPAPAAVGGHRAPSGARSGVLRRSLLGTILGGAAGLLGGIALGALAGGVGGAIIGGVAGLFLGGAIGNSATTRSRPLSGEEVTYASEIYAESLEYGEIEITRGSVFAVGAARTIANTIHLESRHFVGDTLELSPEGRIVLIHEMGHVWQYQNAGLAYIPKSLYVQAKAWLGGGDRNAAYDWKTAHNAKTPWSQWNPEQQAAAIERYNELLREARALDSAGRTDPAVLHELSILLPYIELVRRGEGAPTFEPAPDPGSLLRGSGAGGSP